MGTGLALREGLRTGQNAPVSQILTLARGMDDGERAALAVKGAEGTRRVPLPSAAGTPDRAEHRLPGTIMIQRQQPGQSVGPIRPLPRSCRAAMRRLGKLSKVTQTQ